MQIIHVKMICAASLVLAMNMTRSTHAGGVLHEDEVEPNNSLLTAQVFPPFSVEPLADLGALVVAAALSPGDVDFFQVHFPQMVIFTAVTPSVPLGDNPTLVALFDVGGSMIDLGEDGIAGNLSPGTYTFAVTGAADSGFIGNHSQSFNYNLQLSWVVIPAPSALALLGAHGLLGRSRRRVS